MCVCVCVSSCIIYQLHFSTNQIPTDSMHVVLRTWTTRPTRSYIYTYIRGQRIVDRLRVVTHRTTSWLRGSGRGETSNFNHSEKQYPTDETDGLRGGRALGCICVLARVNFLTATSFISAKSIKFKISIGTVYLHLAWVSLPSISVLPKHIIL